MLTSIPDIRLQIDVNPSLKPFRLRRVQESSLPKYELKKREILQIELKTEN